MIDDEFMKKQTLAAGLVFFFLRAKCWSERESTDLEQELQDISYQQTRDYVVKQTSEDFVTKIEEEAKQGTFDQWLSAYK